MVIKMEQEGKKNKNKYGKGKLNSSTTRNGMFHHEEGHNGAKIQTLRQQLRIALWITCFTWEIKVHEIVWSHAPSAQTPS